MSRRAVVHSIGCRLNQAEAQTLKDRLRTMGFTLVNFGDSADLAIINTCTVTREADGKCRKAIRQFIARNPDAFLAVIGCYSQVGSGEIATIPGVDLIVGNQDKFAVLDYIGQGRNPVPVIVRERIDRKDFTMGYVGDLPFDKRANLKVQDGCSFGCTFCIIPQARGPARSRDWQNLLAEAHAAAARGIKELVLTGVNIGTYSSDGHGILDLVDALNRIRGLLRLRISSIEPTTVPLALIERMADPEHILLPFLHLPLQAGSDDVLGNMRRRYTVAEYEDFVHAAMRIAPDLCLGTDIMVGFPGETEEQFEETCSRFRTMPFAYTHVFPFSEREGTVVMRHQLPLVPIPERNRRCARLRRLSASKRDEFMRSRFGQCARVLLEDPQEDGFPGYTEDYIRVRVDNPGHDIRNRLVEVELGAVRGDWMEAQVRRFIA